MNAHFRQLVALVAAVWLTLPPGWCCVLLGKAWTEAGFNNPAVAVDELPACCKAALAKKSCPESRPSSDPPKSPSEPTGRCLCMAAADELAPPPAIVSAPEAPVGLVAILPPPVSIEVPSVQTRVDSVVPLPTLSALGRCALLRVWRT